MARRDERRRGGGGRVLVLTLLAAAVAAVMLYLGNCVPGFGIGGSSSPSSSAPAAPRTEGPAASAANTLELKVDGDRCRRADEPPDSCSAVCESLGPEQQSRKILVDGTLGTHAAVDALRRCLTEHGFRDVVVRTE